MHFMSTDIGSILAARFAAAGIDVTAGGTGDATEVNGAWIDRQDFHSLKALITYTATLAATETMSLAANLQDADAIDGTGAADFGTALAATTVATGPGGGGTLTGVAELDFNLLTARRYIRLQFTPNLSASGTDVAEMSATYVLGGSNENPVTATLVDAT